MNREEIRRVSPRSRLHEKLRNLTRQAHDEVEADSIMRGLLSPTLTSVEYARILSAQLSLYAPFEKALAKLPLLSERLPDLHERWKSAALEHDLQHLPSVPRTSELKLPDSFSPAFAMGVLYVLEGSTLGARLISKRLREHAFINDQNLTFYNFYGEATPSRWHSFLTALATLPESTDPETCQGAETAFSYFRNLRLAI